MGHFLESLGGKQVALVGESQQIGKVSPAACEPDSR
jgi:hypothetical protein